MKIANILADNYKVEMFKKELTKSNFDFDVKPFASVKDVSSIKVKFDVERFDELKKLIMFVETHFKK